MISPNHPITLAALQIPTCGHHEELISRIVSFTDTMKGPALVLLPELCLGGFDYVQKQKWVEESIQALSCICALAKSSGITFAGSFWTTKEDTYFNSLIIADPFKDQPQCLYDKQHLFSLSQEGQHFASGLCPLAPYVFHNIPVGFAICFDLRFPELFRYQSLKGIDLFIVPAQWPHGRISHWQTLLAARSIENQAFVLGCNGVGASLYGDIGGHSCLYSPWGETLFQMRDQVGLASSIYSLDILSQARRPFASRWSPNYDVIPMNNH